MHRPKHPSQKPVMVIVDYPIVNEVERDFPWSGASHLAMLSDFATAGIQNRSLHPTYLSYKRPSSESYDWSLDFKKKKNLTADEENTWFVLEHQKDLYVSPELWEEFQGLLKEIEKVKPLVIVVAGKWSLFFLTGNVSYSATQGTQKSQKPLGGLSKHRASLETVHESFNIPDCLVIPVLPPITRQRSPDKIPLLKWDYLKVADVYKGMLAGNTVTYYTKPDLEFILGTELESITSYLNRLIDKLDKEPVLVSVDIETRYNAMIDCIGIADSNKSGICIPFATVTNPNYWTAEQEYKIHELLVKLLSHDNIRVTGQNYAYDAQFIWKFWGIKTEAFIDTMILHHVLYNNMQKDLAFLASIYCEHYTYWKDDQKH